jgi:hypothetical protein
MQITTALRDALAGRHHLLTAALEQAGHLPAGRGLSLDDRTLETSDADGNRVDLSPAAQAFVNGYTPPTRPDAPNYGADLLSDDEMMAQAAQAVQNIRQYRGLAGTPTESQRKAYEDLLGRIAIHYIRSRFPQLGG